MDAAGDVGAPGSGSLDSRPSFGRRVVSCRVLGEIWGETVWPGRGNGEMGKWAQHTHRHTGRRHTGKVLAVGTSLPRNCLQSQNVVHCRYVRSSHPVDRQRRRHTEVYGGRFQGRLLGRRCFRSGHRDAGLIDGSAANQIEQLPLAACHSNTRGHEPHLPCKLRYAHEAIWYLTCTGKQGSTALGDNGPGSSGLRPPLLTSRIRRNYHLPRRGRTRSCLSVTVCRPHLITR